MNIYAKFLSGKRAEEYFRRYCNSNATELYQVYNNFSYEKEKSFNEIKEEFSRVNQRYYENAYEAKDLRIITSSCYFYSCAYKIKVRTPYGIEWFIRVYTPHKIYHIREYSL